jgi:CRISPR-associated protein (TIGR02584 family)
MANAATTSERGWREVLIVTGGSTPQVVTETLYALASRNKDPVVPGKIICVVTLGVSGGFGTQFEARLARLRSELGLPIGWERGNDRLRDPEGLFVVFPEARDGIAVSDIRSDLDAVAFGNLVCDVVRTETADPCARVHVSLAGGRKTMSFHGGAALSLFGRAQDELSHVLVHPADFEFCSEFWFPTRKSSLIETGTKKMLDAKDAKIELALIPYIRARDRLSPEMMAQPMDYAGYIAQINAALGRMPLSLELVTLERRVRIGNIADFTLPNQEFALYQLMAEWARDGIAGAGAGGVGRDQFGWLAMSWFKDPSNSVARDPLTRLLEIYQSTFSTTEGPDSWLYKAPGVERQKVKNRDRISQCKSKLENQLQAHLREPSLADRFGAPAKPVKRGSAFVFGLRLAPEEIEIRSE